MSAPDFGMIKCRLVGGPLDGLIEEDWFGAKTIVLNADQLLPSPERSDLWAIYKRCSPDEVTADGLIVFRFLESRENPTE